MDSERSTGRQNHLLDQLQTVVAVLEERVSGQVRAGEAREARLARLETAMDDLRTQLEDAVAELRREIGETKLAGWRQFWALAVIVVIAAIGSAEYLGRLLIGHIAQTGGP